MKTATALKWLVIAGAFSIVMISSRAEAATSCLNDIDCPDSACGGQVCDYNKGMTCQPAGGAAKGSDGWCTTDSDCKCMGMGATCVGVYCSFTTPPAGGSGGAKGGSGGASATGGSSASGGASASGGTTGASGGTTGATGSGGAASGPSSNSSGGCSVSGSGSASVIGLLFGLSVLGLRRFRRRR